MIEWLKETDQRLFLFLNGLGAPYLDELMYWLSDKYIWVPLYLFLIFRLYQAYGLQVYQPVIALVLVITLSDQFTSGFMKPFFQRLRPCHNPEIADLVYTLNNCGGRYGFASSHAANTFGLAAFFFFSRRNMLSYFLLSWAVLVSYSRIYLGVHYLGDVATGALLGVLFAGMLSWLLFRVNPSLKAGSP